MAPLWNPQLKQVHEREKGRGNPNRAPLAVARKLVAYLLAVDRSGQEFQPRAIAEKETGCLAACGGSRAAVFAPPPVPEWQLQYNIEAAPKRAALSWEEGRRRSEP
ncbi:hypothetical protein [Paludibaculum fermentans]|uniref:Uncharacterized protein n=1 Tax=Paludibaculum fermentans TaxID=1473598 RepID=A0A7S7NPC2_PALFE|nr:hypothetical protein [Paludibaculum fermentans]QOY87311.1 hypothetical protein IRI77_31865 [Paludibaculum fermentans]